jgi:hypothetical protein
MAFKLFSPIRSATWGLVFFAYRYFNEKNAVISYVKCIYYRLCIVHAHAIGARRAAGCILVTRHDRLFYSCCFLTSGRPLLLIASLCAAHSTAKLEGKDVRLRTGERSKDLNKRWLSSVSWTWLSAANNIWSSAFALENSLSSFQVSILWVYVETLARGHRRHDTFLNCYGSYITHPSSQHGWSGAPAGCHRRRSRAETVHRAHWAIQSD